MTFTARGTIQMDGSQAKAELTATGQAAEQAGAGIRGLGKSGSATDSEIGRLTAELGRARKEIDALTRSEANAIARMGAMDAKVEQLNAKLRGVGRGAGVAAGSLGNLTAQFNDIAVMMAAGQNPLQLAIQQGTQITQVIGPMGAAGATRALGGAFLSLLSPVNLITLGTIALGGTIVNWLTAAGDKAETLEGQLDRVSEALERVDQASRLARGGAQELFREFGFASAEVEALAQSFEQISLRHLVDEAQSATDLLAKEYNGSPWLNQSRREDLFAAFPDFGGEGINDLSLGFERVKRAANLEAELDAVRELRKRFLGLAGPVAQMTERELALYVKIADTQSALERVNQRVAEAADDSADAQLRHHAAYTATRVEAERAFASGQEILQTLLEENALRAAIKEHGEGSAQVLELQAAARRAALEETLATLDVSQSLKDEIRAALDAQLAMEGVDIAAPITGAADEASRMAGEIERAVSAMISLSAQGISSLRESEIRLEHRGDPVGTAGALAAERFGDPSGLDPILRDEMMRDRTGYIENAKATERNRQELIQWRKSQAKSDRGGGGGGGGSGSDTNALARFVEEQERQLAILRETDPVQKELLRNRDALKGATEAEHKAVTDLIATRLEEQEAITQATAQGEFFRSQIGDVLTGIRRGGDDAASAIEGMARAIEDAAWQALLLGDGPLSGFLGNGAGGLVGTALNAAFPNAAFAALPANADGGYQYMPGGSRADAGLTRISSGEYIVNATATARHRGLLEWINSGGTAWMNLPGFANGGAYGAAGVAMAGPRQVQLVNTTGHPMSATVEEETMPGGGRREKYILSDMVGDALVGSGGGAPKALRGRYGIAPVGTRR